MAEIKEKTLTTQSAGEEAERMKLSYTALGNAKWKNHSGKQFDNLL